MNKEFKVLSENTIQYISFHNCKCSKMYYLNNALVLDMEWLEVLPEHPENPYNRAHQSGSGKVIIQSPVIDECELYKTPEEKNTISLLDEINFCEVVLMDFHEVKTKMDFLQIHFLYLTGSRNTKLHQ